MSDADPKLSLSIIGPDFNHQASLIQNIKTGTNRAPLEQCQISAQTDEQAIQAWLREYFDSPNTFLHYQKESERLLLWGMIQVHKNLSSFTREDFEAYFLFLKNPEPRAVWCAARNRIPRGQVGWKPFVGPLSASARLTAIRVIQSLVNFLVGVRYLDSNPISGLRHIQREARQATHPEAQKIKLQNRILTPPEWQAFLKTLSDYPENKSSEQEHKIRLKLIIGLLYFLGLRLNELQSHTWEAFQVIQNQWWFIVFGKGKKLAKIPVHDQLMQLIRDYRRKILPGYPEAPHQEALPLIMNWRTGQALGARSLNLQLKQLAQDTAQMHFSDDPKIIDKLSQFSAHWLRHLSATMQDRAGIQFKHIQANLRHDKQDTTRLYIGVYDEERFGEFNQKFDWIV
jgi:integrase/recombinase XerD